MPEIVLTVGPGSFMPPPKVDSAVIRLNIREKPPVELTSEKAFFMLIKAAFSQRRKTAANSIANMTHYSKDSIYAAMDACQIDRNARAEQLTLEMLAQLSCCLEAGQK